MVMIRSVFPYLLFICCGLSKLGESFLSHGGRQYHIHRTFQAADSSDYSSKETVKAMQDARDCAANGLSPGAGLATADEQAEVRHKHLTHSEKHEKFTRQP